MQAAHHIVALLFEVDLIGVVHFSNLFIFNYLRIVMVE